MSTERIKISPNKLIELWLDYIRMKKLIDAVVERMAKYMGEKDMSQYELAQLSSVPYSTIKNIMQKKTDGINLKTAILIANGLGISVDEFLDGNLFNVENLDLL